VSEDQGFSPLSFSVPDPGRYWTLHHLGRGGRVEGDEEIQGFKFLKDSLIYRDIQNREGEQVEERDRERERQRETALIPENYK
jgi:hypothetical protein